MNIAKKGLVAVFAAVAVAAAGYAGLAAYQGTGVNKAPLQFVFEPQSGTIALLKMPRALDLAVRARDLGEARALLEAGANPDLCTHFSGPALNEAADWRADIGMMRLLVTYGADVNRPNAAGTRPLHKVISSFNDQAAEEAFLFLLSQGADIDGVANSTGMTPRQYIEHFRRDNLRLILEAFEQGRAAPSGLPSSASPSLPRSALPSPG